MCAQRVQLKTTIDGAQVPLNPYTDCVKNVRQQMPLAGSKLLGTTVLYVGPPTDKYNTGACYTCKATESSSYYWEAVSNGGDYILTKEAVDGVIGASSAGSTAKFYNEQGAFTEVDMSGYLPLSGGTITGDLNITGSSVNINLNDGANESSGSFSVYVPLGLDEDYGTPTYHSIQIPKSGSGAKYATFTSTDGWEFEVIDSATNDIMSFIQNYNNRIRMYNKNLVVLNAGEDSEIMVSLQPADRYKRVAITAPNGAVINDVPIATVDDISTHATITASSDTLGHIKVDNETITVDENGVATAHAVGHNIFDIFYSMSSKAPTGAMDLSLGTLITSCDTVFPDFWSECLQRRGNAHMFPQFSGNFYYYWSTNVIGSQGIDGFNGNSVCYYNGKIYVLAQGECDGHETPPPQSQEWRQFIVPTEQWDAQNQYSIGDTVLYNGQIWCARPKSFLEEYWTGIGIAPGTTDAYGNHHWALYDLPTQIVAPSIRILTESEWQAEATANGSCGAFVVDEDAKSVRLPKITNMVQPGDVGVFTAAGLPNITGTATQRAVLRDTTGGFIPLISKSDGVFATQSTEYTANTLSCSLYSTQHPTPSQLIIDASRVNSIYGNSTTVQPPAVGAKLYIQVFTSAVPASMAQAGEFINMLEAKADRTELDSYLPLVGGTMTGDILFKSGTGLRMKDASDLLIAHSSGRNADRTCILAGESYHNGASAYLFGSQHASNAGQFSIAANNGTDGKVLNGRPDGTLTWNGQSVLNPIGTVIAFAGNSAPTGYLICNGAAVGRTTYAKLFEVIGTTYGEGDGSTTFNLPNLTNKFIMGSGTAGTSKAAGLPNITGNFTLRNPADYSQSGAFSRTNGSSQTRLEYSSSSAALAQINFSAASSNAIYGKSTTVQPPALTMRFYIKY